MKTLSAFHSVAEIIAKKIEEFDSVVVIVSAMGDVTDHLINLAHQVSKNPPAREHDMLISVGERISMALLAMALESRGIKARSFTGSQAGIITSPDHTNAQILDVRPHRLLPHMEKNAVVIVAGFQGVSREGEITTLGRGGSDTTAVALGAALKAEKIEFYKDVEGIFSEDPKLRPDAKLFTTLDYEQMLQVVKRSHVKVIHPRAIELARKNHLTLHVLSYEKRAGGSMIVSDQASVRKEPYYESEELCSC